MATPYAKDERRPPSLDWNGKLHVVNGSSLSKPYPRDRMFWIITDDCLAVEVSYSHDHALYTGRETYWRNDGETGSWEPDEIMGWTDSYEDAQEAAELLGSLVAEANLEFMSVTGEPVEELRQIRSVLDVQANLGDAPPNGRRAAEQIDDVPAIDRIGLDVEPLSHDEILSQASPADPAAWGYVSNRTNRLLTVHPAHLGKPSEQEGYRLVPMNYASQAAGDA